MGNLRQKMGLDRFPVDRNGKYLRTGGGLSDRQISETSLMLTRMLTFQEEGNMLLNSKDKKKSTTPTKGSWKQ
jgi:hypothetical protein